MEQCLDHRDIWTGDLWTNDAPKGVRPILLQSTIFQRSTISGMSDGESHQNQNKGGGLKRLAMQLAKVV